MVMLYIYVIYIDIYNTTTKQFLARCSTLSNKEALQPFFAEIEQEHVDDPNAAPL